MSSVFDRRAEEAVKAALENKLVLRQIFCCLPIRDLKQCRLVNSTWNFEAVSFIKDFRRYKAHISDEHPCSDLLMLAEVVCGRKIVPINSLWISLDRSDHSECKLIENQANRLDSLLETLPLKCLHVSWDTDFRLLNCPVVSFVIDLLRRKIKELSTLEFWHLPDNFLSYFGQVWAPWLPKLKVLDVGYWYRQADQSEFFIKIIKGAPNLQKFTGRDLDTEILGVIPEDKYSVLDCFRLSIDSDMEESRCSKLALAGPALSYLELSAPSQSSRHFMRRFIYVLEQLLFSSLKSLEDLSMDIPIIPLNFVTSPPLINVKSINISTQDTTPHLLHVLQSIDYPKLLPALYKVYIYVQMDFEPDGPLLNPWENNNAAQVVQVHPSPTVKHLEITADFNVLTFKDLSQIFPNVVHFEADLLQPLVDPTGSTSHTDLWAAWPCLETVTLDECRGALRRNFDAEFLGIAPEEAEILRQLDDESLEKMNIVPTRPSVLTLFRLKKIKFRFYSSDVQAEVDTDQVFLSKLTGIMAFKKMAKQGVEIQFACNDAQGALRLDHLSPFVSFVSMF